MEENQMIKDAIIEMAAGRGPDKSICPSEVARLLFGFNWRKHMHEIVKNAIILHHDHKVIITQQGKIVDVDSIKGPIRVSIITRS